MFVNDITIRAERVSNFFRKLVKTSPKEGKKLATNVIKILEKLSEIVAKIDSAAVS